MRPVLVVAGLSQLRAFLRHPVLVARQRQIVFVTHTLNAGARAQLWHVATAHGYNVLDAAAVVQDAPAHIVKRAHAGAPPGAVMSRALFWKLSAVHEALVGE